ncbi:hypothetical protein HH310_30740 [Actinoplanes sp. TBRC 11911]|uniref:hypothetical protein n=1 Tax=Actinoplanes sp. TBRC 11911 TaxID=2729386 RepID=UPI00145DCE64|nr:hypothetical protein [Actinoplanes sp. TBRC 11911]NMO55550.1 hypothetical protein [Actinoplanes sp. TBRC 11911]
MTECSLCGRPVLGLAGQDWSVLPWMVDQRATDVRPGPAHVRCLHEYGVAREWAEAVEAYYCARWPRWLSGPDWRLHVSAPARRFHLWRSDGRLSSFPYASLRHHPALLVTELAEVGNGAALATAMGTADAGVEVPLAWVLRELRLTDRYPDETGTIARRLRSVGTAGRPELIEVLVARHPLPLDTECRRAAHARMHRPV